MRILLGGLLGLILGILGISVTTWEWWAIMIPTTFLIVFTDF